MQNAKFPLAFSVEISTIGGALEQSFKLFTYHPEVTKIVGSNWIYNPESHRFSCSVKKLPSVPDSVNLYAFLPEPVQEKAINETTALYSQLRELEAIQHEISLVIDMHRQKVLDKLIKNGVKAKPGAPEDAMMILPELNTRLHNQIHVHRSVDGEQLLKLAKSNKNLAKFIKYVKVLKIDRIGLLNALPSLPAKLVDKLVCVDISYTFATNRIKRPKCRSCGGIVLKNSNKCKKCNLPHVEHEVKENIRKGGSKGKKKAVV